MGLDLEAVRSALIDHLLGRLDDLEDGLAHIEENMTGGALPGDAIRAMQIEDDDRDAIFDNEVMRSRTYPLTMGDLKSLIARTEAMKGVDDKHALFTEFAAIEDTFEALEGRVNEAIWQIDDEANRR